MPEVDHGPEIRTERLVLRRWRPDDVAPFAAINADPAVMEYFLAPLTLEETTALIERIEESFRTKGYGLWAVETQNGEQLAGFVGLAPVEAPYPFAPAVEVGWRLARACWGQGFATEAAIASLRFGFDKIGLTEIVSFTSIINDRSRRVMERIGMTNDPDEDFDHPRLPDGHPLRRHVLYRIRRDEPSGGSR
jgi:RimJ/RimL family protein N-acetyltransferase